MTSSVHYPVLSLEHLRFLTKTRLSLHIDFSARCVNLKVVFSVVVCISALYMCNNCRLEKLYYR